MYFESDGFGTGSVDDSSRRNNRVFRLHDIGSFKTVTPPCLDVKRHRSPFSAMAHVRPDRKNMTLKTPHAPKTRRTLECGSQHEEG